MKKYELIKTIYSIVISVFVVAMGVAFICVAADIYYSEQGHFPREVVVEKLTALAIPFIILVGAIAAGVAFPIIETRAKPSSDNAVKLLAPKIPATGNGAEFENAANTYDRLKKYQLIIWCEAGAITLACAIVPLCYLLNTANFLGRNADEITQEMFRMMQNVLPWLVASFVALVVATVANGVITSKKLAAIKTMIKHGDPSAKPQATEQDDGKLVKIKKALEKRSNVVLWVVRGAVFVVAVTFIIVGALNGGAHDVLVKAINICTECIGLG